MTLLDSQVYDERGARRRRNFVLIVIVVVAVALAVTFYWPYYQARRSANAFMTALVKGNYQMAYYLWHADPRRYPMDRFMQDWGPGSPWGKIRTYKIDDVLKPPGGHASGMVVMIRINGISQDARLWVQNGTHELSFYEF